MAPRAREEGVPRSREARRFESYLRSRKLKLTGERLAILAEIFQRRTHFDAETLHADLRRSGGDISRATVYRTLDLLVQCGLVRKSSLGASHASYEAAQEDEHHDHLICLSCRQVLEFYRADLENLQEEVCRSRHFRPLQHSLQIFGLCEQCQGSADETEVQGRLFQLHT